MSQDFDRPVCGLCRKIYNERLDGDSWSEGPFEDEQRDRQYEWLCPECYAVLVEGTEESRDWVATK